MLATATLNNMIGPWGDDVMTITGRRFGAKLRRTDFGILASAGWLEGIWRYDAGDGEGGVRGE